MIAYEHVSFKTPPYAGKKILVDKIVFPNPYDMYIRRVLKVKKKYFTMLQKHDKTSFVVDCSVFSVHVY